ncbi:MAG: hypothetical protein ACRDN0_21580, partial [Trebonia sp.]
MPCTVAEYEAMAQLAGSPPQPTWSEYGSVSGRENHQSVCVPLSTASIDAHPDPVLACTHTPTTAAPESQSSCPVTSAEVSATGGGEATAEGDG